MSSGLASAWLTASFVISWNSTRRTLPPLPRLSATCQAIASPSRSGSVAISTRLDALAAFLISARVFAFSLMGTYSGVKSVSTSAFFRFTASFFAATCQPFVKRHASASLPSRRGLRKPDDLQRDGFRRLALGVELRVRLEIERLAVLQHLPHPRHGILSC